MESRTVHRPQDHTPRRAPPLALRCQGSGTGRVLSQQPGLIIMEHERQYILTQTVKVAASEVIDAFRLELSIDPNEAITRRLRACIEDHSTISNPCEVWANDLRIRGIKPSTCPRLGSASQER